MTSTPPTDAPAAAPATEPDPVTDAGPRVTRDEVRDLGRLRRTVGPDRRLAGVAGGLARHLDVDPVIVRVALVVLVFFGGAGLLVYAACWLLVPEDGRDRAAVRLDDRNRTVALTVVAGLALLAVLADAVGQWGFPWPLVVIAAVALVVLTVLDRDRRVDRPRVTAPPVPHAVDPVTGAVTATAAAPAYPVPAQAVPTYPAPTYPAPTYPAPTHPAPTYPVAQPPPPPRPSRRRGPLLFLFTLALAVLGCAVLGVVELAGTHVAPSAYPALVVATCGVMLLVGSCYGRPGGLILVGLVASAVMVTASVLGPWHGSGDLLPAPRSAAAVHGDYRLSAGEIVLDLSRVQDPTALDGRTIHLTNRTGRLEVVLPPGLSAVVRARVTGGGHIRLFGQQWDGWDPSGDATYTSAVPGAPRVTIDASLLFGEILVHTQGEG